MPVTFFILFWLSDCLTMIVLNAKPKPNDVASAKIMNIVFFISIVCLLFMMMSITMTTTFMYVTLLVFERETVRHNKRYLKLNYKFKLHPAMDIHLVVGCYTFSTRG